MRDFTPRFAAPLNAPRPRGARLLEAFSPKLGRRIRLFERACFEQWIRLADPSVLCLCERPVWLSDARDADFVDFWVRRTDSEHMLLIGNRASDTATIAGVPVRRIDAADLAAAAVWIANWQRMLPTVNATRALLPPALLRTRILTGKGQG